MEYIKTKEFKFFVAVNALFPIIVVWIFEAYDFVMETQALIADFTIFAILAGNIFALVKFPNFRKLFATITILNLLAFVLLGDMSFITSIPNLPFLFKSIVDLVSQ